MDGWRDEEDPYAPGGMQNQHQFWLEGFCRRAQTGMPPDAQAKGKG